MQVTGAGRCPAEAWHLLSCENSGDTMHCGPREDFPPVWLCASVQAAGSRMIHPVVLPRSIPEDARTCAHLERKHAT